MAAIWRISLSNLSRNLLEATELANVLQEVSSSIEVTGLKTSHSARTSSSASGTPTHISTRERIQNALPLHIGAATVPWQQLTSVVSSDALQETPATSAADKQPQLVEVNTGGCVFFLFFKLTREQYLQQLQLLQQQQQATLKQCQHQACTEANISSQQSSSTNSSTATAVAASTAVVGNCTPQHPVTVKAQQLASAVITGTTGDKCSQAYGHEVPSVAPIVANIASKLTTPGPFVREGVAVLKVGFNRLAMQAEQFANELTRHLGIAAPDCRIVRQVGPSADEWAAALESITRLSAGCCHGNSVVRTAISDGGSHSVAAGGCGTCAGCLESGGAGELLAELSHLPCFLLMEFVEGNKLADSSHALQGYNLGVLLEDVGCLFLLDMLLGNADRMPCRRLGWRGNPNNLLYGAPGTRHEGRPVAIDSCVARRPPALKASSEDAAVEQLAQLLLSVPEVSRSLLQQLLGNIKRPSCGKVSRLSLNSTADGGTSNSGSYNSSTPGTATSALGHSSTGGNSTGAATDPMLCIQQQLQQQPSTAADAGGEAELEFSDADVARFQAGLKKCLTGVLQIKGLLEMVSTKTAEWIAEFVADVVQLNPTVLPSPGNNAGPGVGTSGPAYSPVKSPRPSPRPSMRSSFSSTTHCNTCSITQPAAAAATSEAGSGIASGSSTAAVGGEDLYDMLAQGSSCRSGSSVISYAATGHHSCHQLHSSNADAAHCRNNLPPCSPASGTGAGADSAAVQEWLQATPVGPLKGAAAAVLHSSGGGSSSSSSNKEQMAVRSSSSSGSSPAGKAALAKRAASHLGFASIKASICSPQPSQHPNSSNPPTSSPRCIIDSTATTSMTTPPLSIVETAVAAALSPRATRAQTQALVGVFGGDCLLGSDGGIGLGSSGGGRTPSARRVTWGSLGDERERNIRFSPRELFPASSAVSPEDHQGPSGGINPHPRASSASSILCSHHSFTKSCCNISSNLLGSHSMSITGPNAAVSSVSATSPAKGNSSFVYGQPQLLRPASFPASQHSTAIAAAAAAAAVPVATTAQQRGSSSNLQVLASIQLDATLASIKQEARHDGALAERMAHWRAVFRGKGAELSEAIASWQARHHLAAVLSTGFLDGSHPIVDVYELGVRLQHMLRRLTALAAGALVQAPIRVLPGVFLGNAVAADSHHLLQYLGVTHVVNAAQELQVEAAPGLFHVYRVAIRDEEEEDVSRHFYQVRSWIDAALSAGGAVLVHCHEGKSRSVALLLGYLMISKGHTLKSAMHHIKSVRPEASPNAGFMNQLMTLDLELHGAASMCRKELPRAKPEVRVCSICGKAAGVSSQSLDMHIRRVHGKPKVAAVVEGTAISAGGSNSKESKAGGDG